MRKTLSIVLVIILIIGTIIVLGIDNVGPLRTLSTACPAGKVKVVDTSFGQKPGAYDYECH